MRFHRILQMRLFRRAALPVACLLLGAGVLPAAGQQGLRAGLREVLDQLGDSALRFGAEKVYVQTDRSYYAPGDTLWFKAYVLDASTLAATSRSGLLYVEAADGHGTVLRRILVPLVAGTGRGYLPLPVSDFPEGGYELRAYTNWMRNFGSACVFCRRFELRDYGGDPWLVHAGFTAAWDPRGHLTDTARIYLTHLSGRPVSYRNVEVALQDSGKIYHKNALRTDVNGGLFFHFPVSGGADLKRLRLLIRDAGTGAPAPDRSVPVVPAGIQGGDLQFLPEGGLLVAGLSNKVVFKALGPAGRGVAVSGTVYDDADSAVATFSATHRGMGHFYLTPRAGVRYRAVVALPGGREVSFPLPAVEAAGVQLQVSNPLAGDSLEIRVVRAAAGSAMSARYLLAGVSRGIGCFASLVDLRQGSETLRVAKSVFPTGVARIMLLTLARRPVARRLVYIDHHDQLRASLKVAVAADSCTVTLWVRDSAGRPVSGNFSVAITDDTRVGVDTLRSATLLSSLLLSSDIRGLVEAPGYYFSLPMTAERWAELDDLLVAQGWAAYKAVAGQDGKLFYSPEHSFSVSGRVTNIFNKPVAGSQVLLFGRTPPELKVTETDSAGTFLFSALYPLDTAAYMLQARNKRGRSFNVGIEVDEFDPPGFKRLSQPFVPWYMNLDSPHIALVRRDAEAEALRDKLHGGHVLHEVVVVAQRVIPGSRNLNGPGGSDLALSEADMKRDGNMTLRQVLEKQVKAFRLGGKRLNIYVMGTSIAHLVIDGVDLDFFQPEGQSPGQYYDQYLNSLTAEDIKGIEVMTSSRYTGAYFQKFIDPRSSPFDHVFIEITTYSGHGAFLSKTPGVYLYRPPLAFETPARFYHPGRPADSAEAGGLRQAVVYWTCDVITGADGKAVFSFKGNGRGHYSIMIEGTDLQGRLLSTLKQVSVP